MSFLVCLASCFLLLADVLNGYWMKRGERKERRGEERNVGARREDAGWAYEDGGLDWIDENIVCIATSLSRVSLLNRPCRWPPDAGIHSTPCCLPLSKEVWRPRELLVSASAAIRGSTHPIVRARPCLIKSPPGREKGAASS